mgnify:CR=1 FL=1
MKHEFKEIEPKWQKKWEEAHVFHAENDYTKPKYYALVEFPYPSGQGLHVGHPRSYTALDIVARKRRMQGYNVLYPMGWDAFGLPTENFAIKNHIHPEIVTAQNVAHFKAQLKSLGLSFDWDREINTTDPGYYKWTQWIFLQLFKKGLAYKASMPVNWCTSCKCVLANEEVVEGVCERCGSEVIRKEKSQWMLGITKYADRLIDDLDGVDFVLFCTGWDKKWGSPDYYEGFPCLTADAAAYLATLPLKGVGEDTISLDPCDSVDFPNHIALLGADFVNTENLTGLDALIGRQFTFVTLPLKFENSDGCSCRAIAMEE